MKKIQDFGTPLQHYLLFRSYIVCDNISFFNIIIFQFIHRTPGSTGELNGALKGNLTLAQERDRLACGKY